MGTFNERTRELADLIGSGKMVARVEVDQVYAKYQHERLDLKHPSGGKAMFLRDPLYSTAPDSLHHLASRLLLEGPLPGMQHAAEAVANGVREQAPIEFGDLKNSSHVTVEDSGVIVHDRPPVAGRLTPGELREKSKLRSLGFGRIR